MHELYVEEARDFGYTQAVMRGCLDPWMYRGRHVNPYHVEQLRLPRLAADETAEWEMSLSAFDMTAKLHARTCATDRCSVGTPTVVTPPELNALRACMIKHAAPCSV